MSLTIPLAELAGGAAPRIRVEAEQGGTAVAEFGARMVRIGDAMETDRLDREAVTVRSRMQRDLGQLALDMESVGDPDELDRSWVERSSALRDEVLGAADPRNRARLEANWNELADARSLQIGARAIEARNSAWRAGLDEQAYSYVSTAAGADPKTRQAGRDQLADTVAEGIASGRITPEQGAVILRNAAQDGERAALTGRLDTDPEGALAALEAGEYPGLDPLYAEGAKTVARSKVAQRDATAQVEADRQAKVRQTEIGERLKAGTINARAGRVNTWEADLRADPEVRAHPDFPEFEAALELRDAIPGFATMTPDQQAELIAAEAAKPVTDTWETKRLEALQETHKETVKVTGEAAKERLDAITANARAGRRTVGEAEALADPALRGHPGYAEAAAAVRLREAMPTFATLPPDKQAKLIEIDMAQAVTHPWEDSRRKALEASKAESDAAWAGDAIAHATKLGFQIAKLPDPAGDPADFAEGLAARRRDALWLHDRKYTKTPVFFSAEERAQLAQATGTAADPETRAALAQGFLSAFGKDAPRALAEIGGDEVFAHMGSLASAGGPPGLVAEAFRGQQAIDGKVVALPKPADRRQWADDVLGDVLAGDAVTEARILKSADAIYAARAPRSGEPDADAYKAALQAAIGQDATARGEPIGGVQEVRGARTILPIGVSAEAVETALDQDDAADRLRAAGASGGAPLYAGQPLSADMVGGLKLRAVGNDAYALYVERRGRRFDVTDSSSGRPYVVRLSRFVGGRP